MAFRQVVSRDPLVDDHRRSGSGVLRPCKMRCNALNEATDESLIIKLTRLCCILVSYTQWHYKIDVYLIASVLFNQY